MIDDCWRVVMEPLRTERGPSTVPYHVDILCSDEVIGAAPCQNRCALSNATGREMEVIDCMFEEYGGDVFVCNVFRIATVLCISVNCCLGNVRQVCCDSAIEEDAF